MTDDTTREGTTETTVSVRQEARPLTQAQAGLWYAQRLDPRNPVFNTAQYVEIRGPFDVVAFADAVGRAMAEADALAVRIIDEDGQPRQIVDASRIASLEVVHLPGASVDAAQAAMNEDLRTPLDPAVDRLARQQLFVLGNKHHVWYQRVHHVVIDGYGTALLTARICDLYTAAINGTAPTTPAFAPLDPVIDADVAYQASTKRETDRAFWMERLRDAPPAAGLGRKVDVTAHDYRRAAIDLEVSAGDALGRIANETGMQWPDVLAALSAAYVARHGGVADVTVGVAAMERLGTVAARVPAMAMNIVPLRVLVDEDRPIVEWLRALAPDVRRMRRHGRYRGEHLRRDLGLVGADRRTYGVLVNILPFDAPAPLAGAETTVHVLATGPVDDITINLRADASLTRVRAELDGNPRIYSQSELDAHAERLATFLARALRAERLATVPTVTDAERDRVLVAFNDTQHEVEVTTLDRLISESCGTFAGRDALVFGEQTLTYAGLAADVDGMAAGLRAKGVGRGDIVGIALERSLDLIPVIYATIRAGAAYLPLDMAQPVARLQRLIDIAGPKLIVSTDALAERLPPGAPYVTAAELRDRATTRVAPASASDAGGRPQPGDAAYVIFTSGSTGEPKGVVVEHAAIVNRLLWMREHYQVGPDDVLVQKTPTTFDVSVWELFLAALAGATLVVAEPDAHRDPRAMARLFRERGVTMAHFVPSMLAEVLDEPSLGTGALRAVICSGEALSAPLRDRFHARLDAQLHNLYGPTEAAVDVSYWPASREDRSNPVPIGWPVWNTSLFIVDDRQRPVPVGVAGHLLLGGVQLARGYLGRPDLTADRFVPNPFGEEGSRVYRSGDLARWREDGAVEYLGRSDFQVKIRGQRIELGEIEAAIVSSGLSVRAVVVAREARGATTLVAYVQPSDPQQAFDAGVWRQAVAARVPEAMVPSAFVPVTEWPVTANGKLDLRKLPEPSGPAIAGPRPSTVSERLVARCFADVLKLDIEAVSADADFFTLGGHSLLAAQAVRRLREATSDETLELSVLFLNPTVTALASHLDASREVAAGFSQTDTAPLVRLSDGRQDRQALFCIHPAGGLSWCYLTLARLLGGERAVFGIQARGLGDTPLAESLDALADDYVAQVRAIQPHGPYHLLGWSIGGIIAHAMAVRLEALGETVGVLAMLDSYPSDRWRTGNDATEAMALRALLLMAGEHAAEGDGLTRADVIARLRESGHPLGLLSDASLSGVLRVVQHNNRLVRRHEHAPVRARLMHFMADREHVGHSTSPDEWAPYVGGVDVHHVDALHAHMTAPDQARLVAGVLARALES
ncbi:MAG: amino acid adenylation domain-containing protein [Acidobacteria bacterium]|nr:amino acid adenylation domain-containing protein [Acidobacteriota bacterium]